MRISNNIPYYIYLANAYKEEWTTVGIDPKYKLMSALQNMYMQLHIIHIKDALRLLKRHSAVPLP